MTFLVRWNILLPLSLIYWLERVILTSCFAVANTFTCSLSFYPLLSRRTGRFLPISCTADSVVRFSGHNCLLSLVVSTVATVGYWTPQSGGRGRKMRSLKRMVFPTSFHGDLSGNKCFWIILTDADGAAVEERLFLRRWRTVVCGTSQFGLLFAHRSICFVYCYQCYYYEIYYHYYSNVVTCSW